MSARYLFMGEQPDPEMDVAAGRGYPRIYDGTAPLTEADERMIRDSEERRAARPAYTGERGGFYFYARGGRLVRCVCGRCFYGGPCGEVAP